LSSSLKFGFSQETKIPEPPIPIARSDSTLPGGKLVAESDSGDESAALLHANSLKAKIRTNLSEIFVE